MKRSSFALFFLVFAGICDAQAEVIYQIAINTSSINATSGSMDVNFNPGPLASQPASVEILGMSSDGAFAGNCPCGIGEVSGQLPGAVTFDNGTSFNDYFDGFTFDSTISFDLDLFGPAIDSPDGTSTSGNTFAFSLFSDPSGTIPALTTDTTNGFLFTADVNLDGTVTFSNNSAQTTITPLVSATPEPSPAILMFLGLAAIGFVSLYRRLLNSRRMSAWHASSGAQ